MHIYTCISFIFKESFHPNNSKTLWQSNYHHQRLSVLELRSLHCRWLQRPKWCLFDSLHTQFTARPGFLTSSDISFHKAVYSQGSNTKKAWAGASKEGPSTDRPPQVFTPPQPPHAQVSPLLLRPQLLPPSSFTSHSHSSYYPKCQQFSTPALSHSLHPLGWCYPAFLPFVIPKVGSSLPLVLGSHPEFNLHVNLHLIQQLTSQAYWTKSITVKCISKACAWLIHFTYIVLLSKHLFFIN